MKKLIALFAATLLTCAYTYAQQAPVQQTEEYCEVRTAPKAFLSRKSVAFVDFGQGSDVLKDDQGKSIEFVSSVGALNYMNSKGWQLVDVRTWIDDGDSYTYYVMKRRLPQQP